MQTHLCRTAAPLLVALLGLLAAQPAAAQRDMVTVPRNTVARVTLDQPLTSATAKVGDQIVATIDPADRSGFPIGTRFLGVVTVARKATPTTPGVVDIDWYAVRLPGARATSQNSSQPKVRLVGVGIPLLGGDEEEQTVPIEGELAGIGPAETFEDDEGRLFAREEDVQEFEEDEEDEDDGRNVSLVGTAAGAALGAFTGLGLFTGALLGTAASYFLGGGGGGLFSALPSDAPRVIPAALVAQAPQRAVRWAELQVPAGTALGVRLEKPVTFRAREHFRFAPREAGLKDERVLGLQQVLSGQTAVFVNGNRLEFADARPMVINGMLHVPLAPVARATGMRLVQPRTLTTFTLEAPTGVVRGAVGATAVAVRSPQGKTVRLAQRPILLGDDLYVPVTFLGAAAGLGGIWDPAEDRLELVSRR